MLMSRRKQLHPKSSKGKEKKNQDFIRLFFFADIKDDEMLFVLPDGLQYNEKVSDYYLYSFIYC